MITSEVFDALKVKPKDELRVLVLGLPGSGKSTLARQLDESLGIKHIESDDYFWHEPGRPRSREEFRQTIEQELKTPGFVIEGHFKDLYDIIGKRPNHVIWLDSSFLVVFVRNLKRELTEKGLRSLFKRSSSFWFLLRNFRRLRDIQAAAFAAYQSNEDVHCLRLNSGSMK